jgi:hypothetical protein
LYCIAEYFVYNQKIVAVLEDKAYRNLKKDPTDSVERKTVLLLKKSPIAEEVSTLKMEAIRSSEMSVNARSIQCHIPEDDLLQQNSRSDNMR